MTEQILLPECPFYLGERKHGVYCEGPEKGSFLQLCFSDKSQCSLYQQRYCRCRHWQDCMMAKMLYGKYGESL